MIYELNGLWNAEIPGDRTYAMQLPGTLDENRIGEKDEGKNQWHPDITLGNLGMQAREDQVIATRYTRKYTHEGPVRIRRKIRWKPPAGERVFLEAERARCLRLFLDGEEIPHFREPSLNTPHIFEVTGIWREEQEAELLLDNSYPDMPAEAILSSSAATDETQTNWNGILGYFRLRTQKPVFVENVSVYPKGNTVTVKIEINADVCWSGRLILSSAALRKKEISEVSVTPGRTVLEFQELQTAENILRWDEGKGNLYTLIAELSNGEHTGVTFGVREFGAGRDGRFTLNGRVIFLRSEANCAVFPETGHPPMEEREWEKILKTYRSYGVNCVRFHSHCPPPAAFDAADRLGMMMQPELSHWAPEHAFESEESIRYYCTELKETLRMLANHPSFVMMTFGNELAASETGHERMRELLEVAKKLDDSRMYAEASNPHYGEKGPEADSDFYTAQKYHEFPLRAVFANMEGYLNHQYPSACISYDRSMEEIRKEYQGPVFGFEVGQYEVLPDFGEMEEFHGVTLPENLSLIRKKVEESGLLPVWGRYVEASGELSRLCYREEVEAVLRTRAMSGISLLGLQDFPGQGTALVGMMNSHLEPKPYPFARPEAFRSFFASRTLLVLLERYTYETTEHLPVRIRAANYGEEAMEGPVICRLEGEGKVQRVTLEPVSCPPGKLSEAGYAEFSLDIYEKPSRLELIVSLGVTETRYPVWVYPPVQPVCPEDIYQAEWLDDRAEELLREGKKVYLSPRSSKDTLPFSVQAQFSPDFWSVGTFDGQEGCMGQLIDQNHPLFERFPTEFHTNWQWWPMAVQRAVILPEKYQAIITEMDSYAYLRPMAQLFECRCGGGKLLFSSMGLQNLQRFPEGRALLDAVYRYMDSELFAPEQEIAPEAIRELAVPPGTADK